MTDKSLIVISKSGLSLPIQHKWKKEIVEFLQRIPNEQRMYDYTLTDEDIAESLAMHIRRLIKEKQLKNIQNARFP